MWLRVDFCGLKWYNFDKEGIKVDILTGTYEYFLDEKGRTRIPQAIKDILGENLFVGKGTGTFLTVYSQKALLERSEIAKQYQEPKSLDEDEIKLALYYRDFFSDTAPFVSDNQKRYRIPKNLINYAGLSDKIILVGNNTILEIWSPENYEHKNDPQIAFSRILSKKG